MLVEALDGYEPPPGPEPEPDPDPDPDPEPENGIHKRIVDLRMVEGLAMDCGVKVTANRLGITSGVITIYASKEPLDQPATIVKRISFALGRGQALAKMCRANWRIEEADTAFIVADKEFSASEYVGVPGIEPL